MKGTRMSDEAQTTTATTTHDADLATATARIATILAENPHAEDEDPIRRDDGLVFADLRAILPSIARREQAIPLDANVPAAQPVATDRPCSQALMDSMWRDLPYVREDGWRIDTIEGTAGPFESRGGAEAWVEGQSARRARLVALAASIWPMLWERSEERIPNGAEAIELLGSVKTAAHVLAGFDASSAFDARRVPEPTR